MSRIDTLLAKAKQDLCEVSEQAKAICKDKCGSCPLDAIPDDEPSSTGRILYQNRENYEHP
ncbi:hypothetical protein [Vibrio parahaemolyticus]|uniref:hypothetical protein n=1 Tax=Vibrio parahaemolyticus TaxID=670 RepID=UPI003D81A6FF